MTTYPEKPERLLRQALSEGLDAYLFNPFSLTRIIQQLLNSIPDTGSRAKKLPDGATLHITVEKAWVKVALSRSARYPTEAELQAVFDAWPHPAGRPVAYAKIIHFARYWYGAKIPKDEGQLALF